MKFVSTPVNWLLPSKQKAQLKHHNKHTIFKHSIIAFCQVLFNWIQPWHRSARSNTHHKTHVPILTKQINNHMDPHCIQSKSNSAALSSIQHFFFYLYRICHTRTIIRTDDTQPWFGFGAKAYDRRDIWLHFIGNVIVSHPHGWSISTFYDLADKCPILEHEFKMVIWQWGYWLTPVQNCQLATWIENEWVQNA